MHSPIETSRPPLTRASLLFPMVPRLMPGFGGRRNGKRGDWPRKSRSDKLSANDPGRLAVPRLSPSTLSEAASGVRTPEYDRTAVTPGIVHLGVGAFHRAHMAVYIERLLAADETWGIVGASLRRPDTKEALGPQGGLYTVAIRDATETRCRIVGSLIDVLDANTEREQLLAIMAHPDIRIVSLTITEKGYCHDPATGELDEDHPEIQHDLETPTQPLSAPGLIVEALARRMAAGVEPFAVLSCDNLPANGATTRRIVTRFATLRDQGLGDYVSRSVVFPGTMVDRIVPATTDEDRAEIAALTGLEDAWPVVTEPFSQFVIENNFPGGRPAFESVGAELVDDVAPFERMKLRMLNGSHSTIAYLGYLAGHQYVADAVSDSAFRDLIAALMTDEVMPTLGMERERIEAYRDRLLTRFANPALRHRTWQIAMDGSQKLPQRLLDTIRSRLRGHNRIERLALGVAGWMRYVTGIDENGATIEVRDPMAARLRAIADEAGRDATKLAGGLLGVTEIFGDDLAGNAEFREPVIAHLQSLFEKGAAATVREVAGSGAAARLLG
jgi:fructuronate reductase